MQPSLARKTKAGAAARKDTRDAWLFLLPSLFGFLCFVLVPMLLTVGISFTKYNVITPPTWTGLKNWAHLTSDPRFVTTLGNSFKFTLLLVPMHMIFSILLALGVNALKSKKAVFAFRPVYYFPTLIATTSVAMVRTSFTACCSAWDCAFSPCIPRKSSKSRIASSSRTSANWFPTSAASCALKNPGNCAKPWKS